MKALIFDCDGVLVDTERDGHRVAFNQAFEQKCYEFQWDVPIYGELLEIAGGKERLKHYFDNTSWPKGSGNKDDVIKQLHKLKTELFMQIIEFKDLPLRTGIKRLIDEAIADDIHLAVCSTSNEQAVNLIVEKLLGPERRAKFDIILAGDMVSKKKPDPEIYNLALQKLHLQPSDCVVVEDSLNGLLAAKSANLRCVITTNGYTQNEVFTNADLIVPELGDEPNVNVTLDILKKL